MPDQPWEDYADAAYLLDTDTLLAKRGPGGVEVPASAIIKKDASGNAAIGTTPSTWVGNAAFQIGTWSALSDGGAYGTALAFNAYYDGNWRYKTANAASRYEQDGGHRFYIAGSGAANVGISFNLALNINSSGHVLPGTANTQDLGSAPNPWRNGSIQNAWTITSDADKKMRGPGLSDAEIRAGKRIAAELCWWQWLDSIADPEKQARYHFGPMAQDIARIFIEEGVEADYANAEGKPSFRSDMLGWDEWEEVTEKVTATRKKKMRRKILHAVENSDDGTGKPFYRQFDQIDEVEEVYETGELAVKHPAGSGWRIDPSQVAFFLIAAINEDSEQRLAKLEARS